MFDDLDDLIENNTLPLALLGVGMGWLLLSAASRTETVRQATDRASTWADRRTMGLRRQVRGAYADARSHVERTVDDARHRLHDRYGSDQESSYRGSRSGAGYDAVADYDARPDYAAHGDSAYGYDFRSGRDGPGARRSSGERRADLIGDFGRRAGQVNQSLWQLVDEHPIAAGALGLALGAALGATLPATAVEDEWLGNVRDRMVDRAWEEGSTYARQAGDVMREAASAGSEAARAKVESEPAT